MKIRTDFVSNSSSSSFVLVGVTFEINKFIKQIFSDPKTLDELNAVFETNYTSINKFLKEYSIDDILDFVCNNKFEETYCEIETAGDDFGEIDEVAVGLHPCCMEESETLEEFKNKVATLLKSMNLKFKKSDIDFITGGSDASGSSWFYSQG